MEDIYRHEFKYRCSAAQLAIIKKRIENILPLDRHATKGVYCVRSMYFDNYNNRCFLENRNGTDPRSKFRIRIYDANDSHISLECKRKTCGKTLKTACLITKEQCLSIIQGGQLGDIGSLHPLLRRFSLLMQTERFRPSIIVEYDRTPYVYSIGNVRVTLDQNIRSSAAFDRFFDPFIPTRPVLTTGEHLLELKYDALIPDFIPELLQLDGLQQTTFSKFYLCKYYSIGGQL